MTRQNNNLIIAADLTASYFNAWRSATAAGHEQPGVNSALIHHRITAMALRHPDKTALLCDEQSISYAQLELSSNRVAQQLIQRQTQPSDRIGVMLDRSIELVVVLLGILKVGAAYVPLDPKYPPERIGFMLEDADISAVFTASAYADRVAVHQRIDIDVVQWDEMALDFTPLALADNNLAYVIYTSGSTGQPKGVLVEHQNFTRLLDNTQQWFHFDGDDRWTFFHSFAFDFSVWEIWGALCTGGSVVVVPYETARSPAQFHALLRQQKVTVLNQTPSAFYRLSEQSQLAAQRLKDLRLVIFGGEALNFAQLKPWRDKYGLDQPELVNMYGITETTVHVTYQKITAEHLDDISAISRIGVAIPDLKLLLLDQDQQPVAPGQPGELYIGGGGVTRGYLNREALNQRSFVELAQHQGRFYRSGDLVQQLEHGELGYIGRIDNQVQLHGYRIELGEIEAVLRHLPLVDDACVLCDADQGILIAYLHSGVAVNDEQPQLTLHDVRSWLSGALPEHMIPGKYLLLDSFPLTVNGKLDKVALAAGDWQPLPSATRYVTPQTPLQRQLATLWQQHLGGGPVGLVDDFFQRGGDSMSNIRMVATLAKTGTVYPAHLIFSHPTLKSLASAIERIQAEPTAVEPIAVGGSVAVLDLGLASVPASMPLTATQSGMLFHALSNKREDMYVEQLSFRITKTLDLARFKAAWQLVISHYGMLRTAFVIEGVEEPQQQTLALTEMAWDWQVNDWRHKSDYQRELAALIERQAGSGFDLAQAGLLRLTLVQLPGDKIEVIWSWHHLILDGWSLSLVLQQVFGCYAGLEQPDYAIGDTAPDFATYVHWLAQQPIDDGFWQQYLNGFTGPTKLGIARRYDQQGTQTLEAAVATTDFSRLKQLAAFHRVPVNTLISTAWSLILSLYSGQQDVLFGITVSGRTAPLPAIEQLVGVMINTLPLRVQIDQQQTLSQLIRQVFASHAQIAQHEHSSLADIGQLSAVQGSLFDTLMVFENYPLAGQATPAQPEGAEYDSNSSAYLLNHEIIAEHGIEAVQLKEDTNYPLTLTLFPGEQLLIRLLFDRSHFDQSLIQPMLDNFAALLRHMNNDSDKPLAELGLLSAQQQQQQQVWQNNRQPFESLSMSQMMTRQASATADKIAVHLVGKQLSYHQLEQRSNQLAHYLAGHGVGPGKRVGLLLKRDEQLIIALYGVLKTGASYVPLDIDYPQERLAFIANDADCYCILSSSDQRKLVSSDALVLLLDQQQRQIGDYPSTPQASVHSLNTVAYTIYTSGSTGQPKGVEISHNNVAALMGWAKQTYNDGELGCVLACTSICFDLSVFEIFCTLGLGGSIYLVENALQLGYSVPPVPLTLINTVPSIITELAKDQAIPDSVRVINLAGEPLGRKLVNQLYDLDFIDKIYNLYGPSEDTTYSTFEWVPRDKNAPVYIGHPLPNTQALILDQDLQPVPLGCTGELVLSGAGVARGYINRAQLNREKFITLDGIEGVVYRTGDSVRGNIDGKLEYLGRQDQQIKFRGVRIELQEIELVAESSLGVDRALVRVVRDEDETPRLVAWLIASGAAFTLAGLKADLKKHLPRSMNPTDFVLLDEFPLTANKKIDTQRLPLPTVVVDEAPAPGARQISPQFGSPTEERLHPLWCRILDKSAVASDADFFAQGGHSLLATKLMMAVKTEFGVAFTLSNILDAPTINEQARFIDQALFIAKEHIAKAQAAEAPEPMMDELLQAMEGMDDDEINQLFNLADE
jgi:amino acid adenylation domain-containing protein